MGRGHEDPAPSWQEAREIAHATGVETRQQWPELLATQEVELAAALGRYLAEDLYTGIDLPHYNSAAMDGWALAIDPGYSQGPWALVSQSYPASVSALGPGEATRVVTGGLVPEGTDVVLALEQGSEEVLGAEVRVVLSPEAPGKTLTRRRHIREAGTEAPAQTLLVPEGESLNPGDLALIAASGADNVNVVPYIDAAVVRSGNEVVASGMPKPGQVRDSFSLLLPPALRTWGAQVSTLEHIPDTAEATRAALNKTVPLLVSTGGTGPSAVDHFYPSMRHLGGQVRIPSIAMRPGHPAMLALMPQGSIAVALPGNPLAALSAAITIVEPALAGLRGAPLTAPVKVRSGSDIGALPGRIRVLPGVIGEGGVRESGWSGSGMLRGLARAQVLMIIPEHGIREGEGIEVLPVPWQSNWSAVRSGQQDPHLS